MVEGIQRNTYVVSFIFKRLDNQRFGMCDNREVSGSDDCLYTEKCSLLTPTIVSTVNVVEKYYCLLNRRRMNLTCCSSSNNMHRLRALVAWFRHHARKQIRNSFMHVATRQ